MEVNGPGVLDVTVREGRERPVQQDGSRLSLKVPSIRDLEIVAIDLESWWRE